MIYKSFQDIKLSALGMGCMRLPCVDKNSNIDTLLNIWKGLLDGDIANSSYKSLRYIVTLILAGRLFALTFSVLSTTIEVTIPI